MTITLAKFLPCCNVGCIVFGLSDGIYLLATQWLTTDSLMLNHFFCHRIYHKGVVCSPDLLVSFLTGRTYYKTS
jgi:hypothetical protein